MTRGNMGLLEYLAWIEGQIAEREKDLHELHIVRDHARRAAKEMSSAALPKPSVEEPEDEAKGEGAAGRYASMTPRPAALAFLGERQKPASTVEIREALVAGGVKTDAEKFHQTLYNTLQRMAKKGTVVNLGDGVWGLPEWGRDHNTDRLF